MEIPVNAQTVKVSLAPDPSKINAPGGVLAWTSLDPIIIIGLVIDITTPAAAKKAAHVDFGAVDDPGKKNDNLISKQDVSKPGAFGGNVPQKNFCVTGTTVDKEDASGLQGFAYITYLPTT